MANKKVLVTGGNGHLGNTLAKALCDKGYQVRVTIRDMDEVKSAGIFDGYAIEFFEADLRDEAAVMKAMEGITGVFQVAQMHNYSADNIYSNNTECTKNVLHCAHACAVDRVVMMSSIVAVGYGGTEEEPMTEESWNNPTDPYNRSKADGERAAWKFAEEVGLDLITIIPSMIMGPYFYKHTPSTMNVGIYVNNQTPFLLQLESSIVDVRDVAEAAILAYENKAAAGRYLVSGIHTYGISNLLQEIDPDIKLPERVLSVEETKKFVEKSGAVPVELIGHSFRYSDRKSETELGWRSRPIKETLADTVAWIKENNM